ncbi:MAG TPA: DUF4349 domain-containing protein [Solirubrobacteraceae bacterium]|nr:DUF4349 domain-containing protein [Solirubrobacteraceae bacterium]
MSRDEETARRVSELDALERILAHEPIAEEHLELAALVDSVRAGAPSIDPVFAASLEQRFAARTASRHRARRGRPRVGQLAIASGGLVAAAATLTILLSGSVRDDIFGGGHTLAPAGPAAGVERTSPPAHHSATVFGAANASGPAATHGSPATPLPAQSAIRRRLVQRGSTLTLSTPAASMQTVANRLVAATEQLGGVVENSNVSIRGRSSYANFSLQVPSARLARLISALSSLASVAALNQSTQDITNPYTREVALLAKRIAQRASLRRQLAVAVSATQAASLRKQIAGLNTRIAIEQETITRLQRDAADATLAVQLVVGAAPKRSGHTGALAGAYHDALHALEEILAIALVVLAIVLPFALCGLALWWAATAVRQRARERAIRAA